MSIKHEHTLHPITALEFHGDQAGNLMILAGEGSLLKVFDAQTSRLLCQCKIFEGQTIHGIAVRDEVAREHGLQVAVWGGSSLILLQNSNFRQLLDRDMSSVIDAARSVSDWILDVAISPGDDGSCVLVTAHNTVLRARLENPTQVMSLEELYSPSRSILYSAHLIWESPNRVLVAAGTVFGEIISWQCSIPGDATASKGLVLFTFTGHEGSIFGVNISPPILRPDKTVGRLLASCSDDRTIRVWDLSSASAANPQDSHISLLRETGFGENGEPRLNTSIAMAMGHASRIWRVRFLVGNTSSSGPNLINILSFGEDSAAHQWSLVLNSNPQTTENNKDGSDVSERSRNVSLDTSGYLANVKISAFHSGKHICSASTREVGGGRSFLATGGADGKVALYNVDIVGNIAVHSKSSEPTENPFRMAADTARSVWDLAEVLGTLQTSDRPDPTIFKPQSEELLAVDLPSLENPDEKTPKKKKAKKVPKDAFNRYAFVSEDKVLVTTTSGRVLLGHIRSAVAWEEIYLPGSGRDDLKSYAMLEGFPEIGRVYLAGANGKIYCYHGDSFLSEVGDAEGKVADMFKVIDSKTKCFELLVTTLAGKDAALLTIGEAPGKSFRFSAQSTYHLPEKFIVTSAGRIGNILLLGSRSGSIAVYSTERQDSPLHLWNSENALFSDAITTTTPLTSTGFSGAEDVIYFLTTSRSGVFSILACTFVRGPGMAVIGAAIRPVHHGSPPFGPMIENAWFSEQDLILYGFKGKNFVVWNETKQCEISNVECGGGHRSYAYLPVDGAGYLIYTKASKLYLHTQLNPSHQIIKNGGHGREIKACAVSLDKTLVATGAEDTTIRIWTYIDSSLLLENELICLAVVQKHNTGIQHLHWHKSTYLFSSGGNEEFFIWAVEQVPGFGIGVVCEGSCPDQSEDRDLRIMGFDTTELSTSKLKDEARLLISLAYSDSTIRMYTYSRTDRFHLVATGRYTSSCLMQIRHIQVTDEGVHLLTAATDGNLTLWKGKLWTTTSRHTSSTTPIQQLAMLSTKTVHQNSIKSLDLTATKSKSQVIVATGGDDNALGISIYTIDRLSESIPTSKSFVLKAAHSAAITGLSFMPALEVGPLGEDFRIVSSSNDQKVKTWEFRAGNGETENECVVEINNRGDVFTAVADVANIAVLRGGGGGDGRSKVLIVGNGMEVWKVSGK